MLPPADFEMSPSDFDYNAFLEQDADYYGDESSSSNNAVVDIDPLLLSSGSGPGSGSGSPSQALVPTTSQKSNGSPGSSGSLTHGRTRLERRGHTKSRRGCFNCKRRRIKCQETRPACGHCTKTGLKCEYPAIPLVVHQPQHQIPLFSLQDMRFFQHFLMQCYPHHPLGAEHLWTHEIPCLSQKYDYLMHSILGYSASQLLSTDPSLIEPAMAHRLKAIKAVKKALAEAPRSENAFEEGNALMATCFALTFQSVWLDDGMVEYMTFVRGIVIVAIQMYIKGSKLLFGEYLGEAPAELLKPHLEGVGLVPRVWVDAAVEGIKGLEGLVRVPGREVEAGYWEKVLDMAEKLYVGAYDAYQALRQHYAWWMMLPHGDFQRVIDPSNQVGILLATHWISVKQIMATITEMEHKCRAKEPEKKGQVDENDAWNGIGKWLRFLNRGVDAEHRRYNAWPMWVEAQLDKDPKVFGRSIFV
ncbi:hypothetical protein QBC34DRAFT_289273 [Podospora aff. communis PSN243]|uniref:Zn(2)-C6 fungal-type domain-containing protein n=1 Tax=Podospora aff. communis PSN243 TaxID=3040156 RepID=A0AAV9H2E7_9PEZI|nr:hypothetical protein QBC34DRAFT_289273 [Podospora aff. communis PSN243]